MLINFLRALVFNIIQLSTKRVFMAQMFEIIDPGEIFSKYENPGKKYWLIASRVSLIYTTLSSNV